MSRLTRDGTAEPVSPDQILRRGRGQGNIHFPCLADHEQDWQFFFKPYPVDPYSAICDDHKYIQTYILWYYSPICPSRAALFSPPCLGIFSTAAVLLSKAYIYIYYSPVYSTTGVCVCVCVCVYLLNCT